MKILIVDDDPIALELLRHALENSGYEVESASDGAAALRRVDREGFRFVITDWEMPGMGGVELCRKIRSRSLNGYVYLILLTSHGRSDEIVEGMSAGADDFVVKPFHPAELVVRVRAGQRILSLESRETVIFALAKLAESRDPETGKHLERVQQYARALAQRLTHHPIYGDEVDGEFVRLVYQTSPLHDIGKVGIPDSVLLKPGRLSDQEFAIMKTHAAIGAATLEAALLRNPQARFLQMARDIAAAHHERWDGEGYPNGLVGEEIPLAARIVAVADVYDALTSKRVYKEASGHLVARNIIVNESGSHFDPVVVEAFLEVEQEFIDIGLALAEQAAEQLATV